MLENFKIIYNKYLFIKIITVTVVVFFSIAILLPIIKFAELFGINIRENTGLNFEVTFGNVFFFFFFGICSIGIIWLAQKYIHEKKLSELGFRGKVWSPVLIGFFIGAILVSIKNIVLILNAETVSYEKVSSENISVLSYIGYYFYFIIGFIFWNSFIEELGTRAYPIQKLKKYMNPHIIFVIMGVLFTVGHFVLNDFNFGYFLSLFTASYIYSLLYYYSNSIWLTIGIHSGVNWVGFSFFGTSWKLGALYNLKIYNVPSWIADYSNVIIQFAFLLLILYLNKKKVFDAYFSRDEKE